MRQLRKLLLPLSWVYALAVKFRHFLYDSRILKSYIAEQKTIAVGNLSLGGTGKTPLVIYLVTLMGVDKLAVLSRGYGRSTRGTVMVETNMEAELCGDEPLLIKKNHPELLVLVDEHRSRGLEYLKINHPEIKTVLLDDALQHRQVQPQFSILLTTFHRPFYNDFLLPAGDLRDVKSRAFKVDAIVVTKTPEDASTDDIQMLRERLLTYSTTAFFSTLKYGAVLDLNDHLVELDTNCQVIVLTAIANPNYFIQKVSELFSIVKHFNHRDHYQFTLGDINALSNFIDTFESEKPIVITTEKDAQRLGKFRAILQEKEIRVYYWKIEPDFGEDKMQFDQMINSI